MCYTHQETSGVPDVGKQPRLAPVCGECPSALLRVVGTKAERRLASVAVGCASVSLSTQRQCVMMRGTSPGHRAGGLVTSAGRLTSGTTMTTTDHGFAGRPGSGF